MPRSIGFLVVATNKYTAFVPPLAESLRQFFLPGFDRTLHLFTNMPLPASAGTRVHPIAHEPWPMPTLKRYHFFDSVQDELAKHAYLYYLDADMRVVAPIGEEILPASDGNGLVAVEHPGFIEQNMPRTPVDRLLCRLRLPHRTRRGRPLGTYETNPASTAAVPADYPGIYFCGGMNGGTSRAFLAMAREIRRRVDTDIQHGITAVWHDESHLNRYLIEHPPQVMPASYCYPESWNLPLEKKILALDKDHAAMRT